MDENIFPDKPASKLYTENAIRIATFLGGPLIAGYLIADNYKQLGNFDKVRKTWMFTIASTIVIFAIAWFMPDNIPGFILPIAYTIAVYQLVVYLQGPQIKSHLAAGGETWPIGRAVLAGLVGLIIVIALAFAAFFLMDQFYV